MIGATATAAEIKWYDFEAAVQGGGGGAHSCGLYHHQKHAGLYEK